MRNRLPLLSLLVAALLPVAGATAQQVVAVKAEAKANDSHHRTNRDPTPGGTPAAVPSATLHWNNGESVSGEPTGATNDALVWKTPLFDDPLEIAWPVLHRVDKNAPDDDPPDAFAFILRDGSRIYGDPTGVTADTVSIHSTRHSDAVLRRQEVIAAWRIKGRQLVYGGPWGESGWTAAQNIRLDQENTTQADTLNKVPTRLTGPGGSLVLPFWHRALANPLTLPERADVEFRLHASERPAFQLVLDGREKKTVADRDVGQRGGPRHFQGVRKNLRSR